METQLGSKPAQLVGVVGEESQPGASRKHAPKQKLATAGRGRGRVSETRCTGDLETQVSLEAGNTSAGSRDDTQALDFSFLFKQAAKNTAPGARRSRAAPRIKVSGGAAAAASLPRPCEMSREPARSKRLFPRSGTELALLRLTAPGEARRASIISILTRRSGNGRCRPYRGPYRGTL